MCRTGHASRVKHLATGRERRATDRHIPLPRSHAHTLTHPYTFKPYARISSQLWTYFAHGLSCKALCAGDSGSNAAGGTGPGLPCTRPS